MFDKLRSKFLGKQVVEKSVGPLKDDATFFRTLRSIAGGTGNMDVDDPYNKSVWVYSSIKAIADNMSSQAEFKLYTEDDSTDDGKQFIKQGPLYDLFLNPNPYMIDMVLFNATIIFMELHGEAIWILERDNVTEIPKNIWCLPPDRFTPYTENKNEAWTGWWEYEAGETKLLFAPHEIFHIRYFNPYDDIRGMSPASPAKLGVEQDYFSSLYNKNFFKDGAAIGGIIETEDNLTDEQFLRMRTQFDDRYTGYSKSHKVAIMEGGSKFKEVNVSQRDMEFISLKDVTRGEVLAAYKTNEVVLGNYSNIQSYEGIKQAHKAFWEETLIPKIRFLEKMLKAKFFIKLKGVKKIYGFFDLSNVNSLREDYNLKVEMAEKLQKMGFTINSINKKLDLGLDNVSWGDTWMVPMSMVSVEDILDGTVAEQNNPDTVDDTPDEDTPDDTSSKSVVVKSEKPVDTSNDIVWNRFIFKQLPIENLFKKKLNRFFYEQRKDALKNVYAKNVNLIDVDTEREKLSKILKPIYVSALRVGLSLLEEELTLDLKELVNSNTSQYLTSRISSSSKVIVSTIEKNLNKVLSDIASKTTEQIAEDVRKVYNKASNRVNTIARTEINSIINNSRYFMMLQLGINYHKWISGSKSRDSHKNLNGKVVRLGESFSDSEMLRHPYDPNALLDNVINCTCFCIPVVKHN